MRNGYKLVDGVKRHAAAPATFDLPDEESRSSMKVGDYAKVAVEPEDKDAGLMGERFWVRIKGIGEGCYVGVIRNNLIFGDDHGLECDQEIAFETDNVLDVMSAATHASLCA